MVGRYKVYPEYKDSGVEWLKEIPTHWGCKKLKFFLDDLVRGPFGSTLKKEFFTEAGIKVYEQKNCIQDNIHLGSSYISEETYQELTRFSVKNGDLLMSCSGTIGKIVEVTAPYKKGIINQALLIMRINEKFMNKQFFKYIFRSEGIQRQIKDNSQGGAMQNLVATDIFKSVSFTIPSSEEQTKIANFLDHETAKIDTLIAKQEKLIELLKEKRQAVISHAVTKGLNPDVRMKDSGVEWLGEVPEHWAVGSLRWRISISSGEGLPSTLVEKNSSELKQVPVIGGNGVMGFTETSNTNRTAIAIGRVGALCGNVHLINYVSWITDNALKVSSWDGFDEYYLVNLLKAANLNDLASKTAQPLITGEQIKSLIVVIPPFKEQVNINLRLTEISNLFDMLEEKSELCIDLLKERKTALISAAVTGKIDVRGWQNG